MPKKKWRSQKKAVVTTAKKTHVRQTAKRIATPSKKMPVSVQVFPKPSVFSQFIISSQLLFSRHTKQLKKNYRKVKKTTTQSFRGLKKLSRNFSKQHKFPTKLHFPKFQPQKLFHSLFQELLYPFYYMVRYRFWVVICSILAAALVLTGAYFTYDVAFRDLPPVSQIVQRRQPLTTKILDRNGKLLYSIYKDENRTLIPLSKVPNSLKYATIAIEDRDFYHHHGISLKGILRALKENSQGNLQGGSTITQQLVKNTLLTSERTFKRKIREIYLSFLVERAYTKDQILEMYLNEVAYGGSTYGVEEAAERYFGKSAQQLSLAESAFLAGLPAAPSVFSPFGSTPELAYTRQKEVLRRMVEDGYITQEQANQAKQQTLTFQQDVTNIQAPHFVMYVKELLAEQFGEDVVNQGGLEVRTTLDLDLQNKSQELVTKELSMLARLRISNGAALITNPKTGEILTMVGSKNYFDFKNDGQVNVTIRPRQPGSSIKPLTYSLAFEHGQSPATMINDESITFTIPGSPPYSPKNYDGRFHGNVPIREALASSYNIPAVKTLAGLGISNLIDHGEKMGITTWTDRKRFGLSLTLGGGEVLMTDMAKVYGTFATYGTTTQLQPLLEVKTAKGEVLYRNRCALENQDCPSTKTLSAKSAYQITDILSDNTARTPGFGPRSVLYIPEQQVAVKTGTTNNLRDNWTIGYTQDRVVAVWVGNNNNTPMSYVASGITGASPIWNKIMRSLLDDQKPHKFPIPEGMIRVRICVPTHTLPCNLCPMVREELFETGTEPKIACNPNQFPSPTPSPSP